MSQRDWSTALWTWWAFIRVISISAILLESSAGNSPGKGLKSKERELFCVGSVLTLSCGGTKTRVLRMPSQLSSLRAPTQDTEQTLQ